MGDLESKSHNVPPNTAETSNPTTVQELVTILCALQQSVFHFGSSTKCPEISQQFSEYLLIKLLCFISFTQVNRLKA